MELLDQAELTLNRCASNYHAAMDEFYRHQNNDPEKYPRASATYRAARAEYEEAYERYIGLLMGSVTE